MKQLRDVATLGTKKGLKYHRRVHWRVGYRSTLGRVRWKLKPLYLRYGWCVLCKFGYSDVFDKKSAGFEKYIGWPGLSPLSPLLPGVELESLLGKFNRRLTTTSAPKTVPIGEVSFAVVSLDYSFRFSCLTVSTNIILLIKSFRDIHHKANKPLIPKLDTVL